MNNVAIILGAGAGTRMKADKSKLLLEINGKTDLERTVETFSKIKEIHEIIVVCRESDLDSFESVLSAYNISYCFGGDTRQQSVMNAVETIDECDYLIIHDGARPFLTEEILRRDYEAAERFRACVTGMPVKDTIKIADKEGYAARTPDRSLVWQIQTPQVFESALIIEAYEKLMQEKDRLAAAGIRITDDAMVVETLMNLPVRLVQGSYENIKITTPEDLAVAEAFLP